MKKSKQPKKSKPSAKGKPKAKAAPRGRILGIGGIFFKSANRDQMREWAFVPDARSFKVRYDLAATSGLAGVSSWVLGSEDPAVWDALPMARR